VTRRPKMTCRTCGRAFGSLSAFDAHLGTDAELDKGIAARLRGEPSQQGHTDPRARKGFSWVRDEAGTWRKPDLRFGAPGDGLLAGLAQDEEES
jgi:hypothetical protein